MALIDEMVLRANAGKGGDGVVRWLHERGRELAGPNGGNGGNGGDVYVRAVSDINCLSRYRGMKVFAAEDGKSGEGKLRKGATGKSIYIEVPRGSIITNGRTLERYEVIHAGETVMVLKGGRGGAGNAVFKSSTNRSPTESTPGIKGEEAELHIALNLIADVGLIGLPNAGKSSLLNALTGASAKIGSYAFTTLEANLGMLGSFVLADIPGLIEGASQGKGLGNKFLKHVSRTSLLVHCVSLESEDPIGDYEKIRTEVGLWDAKLLARPELVVLTKSDCRDELYIQQISGSFIKKLGKDTFVQSVTVLDDDSVKKLGAALSRTLAAVTA